MASNFTKRKSRNFREKMNYFVIGSILLLERFDMSLQRRFKVGLYSSVEIQSKNERLVREAQKYEDSIKGDLSLYISQASTQRECFYRNRYTNLLNAPKNHYKLYLWRAFDSLTAIIPIKSQFKSSRFWSFFVSFSLDIYYGLIQDLS